MTFEFEVERAKKGLKDYIESGENCLEVIWSYPSKELYGVDVFVEFDGTAGIFCCSTYDKRAEKLFYDSTDSEDDETSHYTDFHAYQSQVWEGKTNDKALESAVIFGLQLSLKLNSFEQKRTEN